MNAAPLIGIRRGDAYSKFGMRVASLIESAEATLIPNLE
jgi:hypothetical protein